MVYPKVVNGVILRPDMATAEDDDPRPPTGQSLKSLVSDCPKGKMKDLGWVDNETLYLLVDESVDETTKTQSVKYVVSGVASVDDTVSTKTIHITRSEAPVPGK